MAIVMLGMAAFSLVAAPFGIAWLVLWAFGLAPQLNATIWLVVSIVGAIALLLYGFKAARRSSVDPWGWNDTSKT
jgi:hypothetical protein